MKKKKWSQARLKNVIYKTYLEIIHLIYMHKKDLALNNLQWLICNQTKQIDLFLKIISIR